MVHTETELRMNFWKTSPGMMLPISTADSKDEDQEQNPVSNDDPLPSASSEETDPISSEPQEESDSSSVPSTNVETPDARQRLKLLLTRRYYLSLRTIWMMKRI